MDFVDVNSYANDLVADFSSTSSTTLIITPGKRMAEPWCGG